MSPEPLELVREAVGEPAWLVGGALRDRLLGRPVLDIDIVVDGDVRAAAAAVAEAAGGPRFPLSDAYGAWRVLGPDRGWHVDLSPLQGGSLAADPALRAFPVSALAEPLPGGDLIDLHGGRADLEVRRLRMVAPEAFDADPLRVIRGPRLAVELGFAIDEDTMAAARERAPRSAEVA